MEFSKNSIELCGKKYKFKRCTNAQILEHQKSIEAEQEKYKPITDEAKKIERDIEAIDTEIEAINNIVVAINKKEEPTDADLNNVTKYSMQMVDLSNQRRKLIEMYGAHVHLVSKKEGGFKKALELAEEFALKTGAYRPLQFDNKLNVEAQYKTTGQEIIDAIPDINAFVSGIGTGGTLMGIGKKLKENNPNSKVFALEPSTLSILKMGMVEGSHMIEGIGDDFIPGIVEKDLIDDIVLIDDYLLTGGWEKNNP